MYTARAGGRLTCLTLNPYRVSGCIRVLFFGGLEKNLYDLRAKLITYYPEVFNGRTEEKKVFIGAAFAPQLLYALDSLSSTRLHHQYHITIIQWLVSCLQSTINMR